MTILDYETVKLDLKRAVEDYGPDWVDPHSENEGTGWCVYDYELDGEPRHCIVGHVFASQGVPVTEGQVTTSVRSLLRSDVFPATADTRSFNLLDIVQFLQDRGLAWGSCYELVDEVPVDVLDDPYLSVYLIDAATFELRSQGRVLHTMTRKET